MTESEITARVTARLLGTFAAGDRVHLRSIPERTGTVDRVDTQEVYVQWDTTFKHRVGDWYRPDSLVLIE